MSLYNLNIFIKSPNTIFKSGDVDLIYEREDDTMDYLTLAIAIIGIGLFMYYSVLLMRGDKE